MMILQKKLVKQIDMSTLWTFGCSFTAEYNPIDGIHPPYENNYDKYRNWRGGSFPKTWSTLLGEELGYDVMNCAYGGASNYHIFSQFTNVCHLIKKDDILIFGWTQLGRFMAVNVTENIFNQVLPIGQDYNDLGMSKKTIEEILVNRTNRLWATEVHNWIYFIDTFIKNISAESYHWSSDDNLFNVKDKITQEPNFIVIRDSNILDNVNFTEKHNMMWYLTHNDHYENRKQMGKIIDETNGLIQDGHMGEFGHKVQSNVFKTHIKEHTNIIKLL